MVGHRAADHSPADDHDLGAGRELVEPSSLGSPTEATCSSSRGSPAPRNVRRPSRSAPSPSVEVEVERAGGRLDEAPERPAVLAAQRLEPHPRAVGAGRRVAEVRLAPRVGLLRGEARTRSRCCRARSRRRCCRSTRSRSARRRSPSSMKLPASRSLLHGTVGRGARRAPGVRRPRRRRGRRTPAGSGEAVLARPPRGSRRCRANMSKSLTNRGPAWSRRTASAARASTAGSAKSASASARPGRNSMHQSSPSSGPVLDHLGARRPPRPPPACWRARRRGRCRAARRRCATSRTTTSSGRSVVVADPEVEVGQPARAARATRQDRPARTGEAVQTRSRRSVDPQSAVSLSSNASTTASSMVCFGPGEPVLRRRRATRS